MKFLGHALRMLREVASEGPARAQYFNVACALGHRIRGERTEGYQALRCPACGAGVFVLPRSPLPEPPAPVSPSRSRRAGGRPRRGEGGAVADAPVELIDPAATGREVGDFPGSAVEAEIDWEDDPSARPGPSDADVGIDAEIEADADVARPVPAPERRVRRASADPGRRGATARPSGPRERGDTAAAPPREEAARSRRDRVPAAGPIIVDERAGRHRRVRLGPLFLAVALVVVAAVSWRAWRQRRQEYPLIAERARTQGIPALDRGDFDQAHQLLSAGKSAVDALGGAVEGAEDVRHAADEAAVFVNLATESLEEMLDEAARQAPESWSARFDAMFKGRTYLFDSWITAAPRNEQDTEAYQLAYVVLPAGASGRFGDGGLGRPERFAVIDLEGFRLFELARPALGNRVIFGARLADFRFDGESNRWVVRLVPDSGVFMSHAEALESLGWPRPDAALPLPVEEGAP